MTVGAEKDDPQLSGRSSVWSDRRSGLEMLLAVEPIKAAQSPEVKWMGLDGLRATDATWCEWRGVKRLRLWEALALHHHLDPRAMGLTDRTKVRVKALWRKYGQDLDSVLGIFFNQAVWLVEDVRIGCLRVEEVGDPLEDSVVSVQEFLRVASGSRVLADPSPKRGESGLDAVADTPQKYSSPLVEAVVAASSLYRTVADGGSYIPGVHSTVPDVDGFLRECYPWISATKRREICEMVRPPELPKGRKPKRSGSLQRGMASHFQ